MLHELRRTSLEIVPFDEYHANQASELIPYAKSHGLSLADRCCLALGMHRELPVLTADRIWTTLDVNVEVISIR